MYKYVTEDNLEWPQTYMYTEYGGWEFLHDYKESRENFLAEQEIGRAEDFRQTVSEDEGRLEAMLQKASAIMGDGKLDDEILGVLEFLVKVFELRKRLYSEYPKGYKPDEASGYRRYDRYISLGILLSQAYRRTSNLKYLNTLLKLDDTLLSLTSVLDERQKRCVAALLKSELVYVEDLAEQQGLMV